MTINPRTGVIGALLAAVTVAARDKPAHLRYWHSLVAWHDLGCPGGDDAEPIDPPGCSFEVMVALQSDADRVFGSAQGALVYPVLRRKHAHAAARRVSTLSRGPALANLLPQTVAQT